MAFTITGIPLLEAAVQRTSTGEVSDDLAEVRAEMSQFWADLGARWRGDNRRRMMNMRNLQNRAAVSKAVGRPTEEKRALSGKEPFWWETKEQRFNYQLWRQHFLVLNEPSVPDTWRRRIEKDKTKLNEVAKKLLGDDVAPGVVSALWNEAIDEAEAGSTVGSPRTPWDVLERWVTNPEAFREESSVGPRGPRVGPSIEKTIHLTDPRTAGVLVDRTLRAWLGRAAKPNERAAFVAALNEIERANPTITRTEVDETGAEVTTTEGGAPDPNMFAADWTQEQHAEEARSFMVGSWLEALKGL